MKKVFASQLISCLLDNNDSDEFEIPAKLVNQLRSKLQQASVCSELKFEDFKELSRNCPTQIVLTSERIIIKPDKELKLFIQSMNRFTINDIDMSILYEQYKTTML